MVGNAVSLGGQLASLLLRTGLIALVLAAASFAVLWLRGSRGPRDYGEAGPEPDGRRFVRVALAGLWLVDGLLQMQPLMPAGFIGSSIDPYLADEPDPLRSIVSLLARAWTRHPVVADTAVVWVEIGLGLALLFAVRGPAGRLVAWAATAASMLVWLLGEGLGGLVSTGAGWLTGAPGAVLVYAAAAALLLAPWEWWTDGRAQRTIRRVVAGWFLVGALLQSLPGEGFWTSTGMRSPFEDGAAMNQPSWLRAPIRTMAGVASDHAVALNLLVIAALLALAALLAFRADTAPIVAGLIWCGLTWWLAQDFGVLGGLATDPNTGLALGLLLAAALPVWAAERQAESASSKPRVRRRSAPRLAGVVLAAQLGFTVPLMLSFGVWGAPDSAALAADSNGGVHAVPARPIPTFSLTDQNGRQITSGALRGKIVVMSFLDPVCTSECPLIANQLATASRALGARADQVEFVAIDANPIFHSVADVEAFTASHGLAGMPNWHFVCGDPGYTQSVLAAFGMTIDVPLVGMIEHSSDVLFVAATGQTAAYLDDGAAEQLSETYAGTIERELRTLTK